MATWKDQSDVIHNVTSGGLIKSIFQAIEHLFMMLHAEIALEKEMEKFDDETYLKMMFHYRLLIH